MTNYLKQKNLRHQTYQQVTNELVVKQKLDGSCMIIQFPKNMLENKKHV